MALTLTPVFSLKRLAYQWKHRRRSDRHDDGTADQDAVDPSLRGF
jgi:hypothetical protein